MQEFAHNTKGMVVDIDQFVIDGQGKVDLISAIPILDSIPSWRAYNRANKIPRSALARYLVYVYSHDSFMWKMQLGLPEIKHRALELAGLTTSSSARNPIGDIIMDQVYWLNNPEILDMAHDYLRFQNKDLWSEFIILQHQIDDFNKLRLIPQGSEKAIPLKEQKALRIEVQEMIKEKEIIEKKFYGQYLDAKDGMRRKMITIESRAMNILDNVETD